MRSAIKLTLVVWLVLLGLPHVEGFVDDSIHEYVCENHLEQIWGGTWESRNYSNMTECSLYPQHGFPRDFWILNVEKNPGQHYCSKYKCPAKDWANHWAKVAARWSDYYINGSRENETMLWRAMCAQCIADHYVADLQEDKSKEDVLQAVLDYNWAQNGSISSHRSWNPTASTPSQLREIALNVRKCEERMELECDQHIAWVMENEVCESEGMERVVYNNQSCPPCIQKEFDPSLMCPPCEPTVVEKIVKVDKPYQVPCPKPPTCPECSTPYTTIGLVGVLGLMCGVSVGGLGLIIFIKKQEGKS